MHLQRSETALRAENFVSKARPMKKSQASRSSASATDGHSNDNCRVSHGAALVDQQGNITVNSDATRQVLEWFKKLVPYMPKDMRGRPHYIWHKRTRTHRPGERTIMMMPGNRWHYPANRSGRVKARQISGTRRRNTYEGRPTWGKRPN